MLTNEHYESFINFNSILYKTVDINGMGLRVLGVHYMNVSPSWIVTRHKHLFYEFHYVCEGETIVQLNDCQYTVSKGQFYILPPGKVHAHEQPPQVSHKGFALRWEFSNTEQCQQLNMLTFQDILKNASTSPVTDQYGILNLFKSLLEEVSSNKTDNILLHQLAFFKFLFQLSNVYHSSHGHGKEIDINYEFIEMNDTVLALDFMEQNYAMDLKANDIAMAMHISYSHLCRLFKKHLNETVMGKLNKIRLEKAKDLLLFSSGKLDDIAAQTGFKNQYYFSSVFKKQFGVTPGEFRTQNKCTVLR